MPKLKYKLTRSKLINGFFKTNRASTDALSVLATWELINKDWSYEVLTDQDHQLTAELTIQGEDLEQAGLELERLCEKYGVTRKFIP